MGSPLVSCVVPAFNAEAYLAEAIDSILQQTHAATEIIVVDDGSTDSTGAIIAGYGTRLVALRQDNAGPASALNAGVRIARGGLVAFLDADDVWMPDKLAHQLARLEANSAIDVTSGRAQNFWEAEMSEVALPVRERITQPFPAPGLTMLVRRKVFDTVGLFYPDRAHSYATEWLLRVRERGLVVDQSEAVLVRRRLHPGNRSREGAGVSREEFLRLIKERLDRRRAGR